MKRICAWCKKELPETEDESADPDFSVSHGMCEECKKKEYEKLGLNSHNKSEKEKLSWKKK